MSGTDNDRRPKRQALGRGLGALIPSGAENAPATPAGIATARVGQIRRAPAQPRRHFDSESLEELAASIRTSGLLQPLVVREKDGAYELIAGERRWRACQMAGIEEVPVVVKQLNDSEAFATALVENIQREDLDPIEEAEAFQRLLSEFGYTQQTVADAVGKSRSAVANSVRLLNLPAAVREYVSAGELTAGHARTLAAMPPEDAAELADIMVRHGYSVREAEELARDAREPAPEAEKPRQSRWRDDAQVRAVTERLQQALGTRVTVKDRQGRGKIEIHYADYDVLQDVLDRLLD